MRPSTGTGVISAGRSAFSDLVSDGRGWILLSISFGWFLGLGVRLTAPALVPYIRVDFGLDLSTAGLLLSTLWITYALLQLPGGLLGDRIGERTILFASSVLGVVGVSAIAISWSLITLWAGFALLGSATGIYATTRFTSISDVFPERAATAMGLSSSAGNLGTVLLPAGAGLLAAAASWRVGFAATAPLFGLAAAGIWLFVPERTSGHGSAVDELTASSVRRIASGVIDRRVLVFTVAMFLMSFVYQGFTSFFPTYLVAMKDFPESTAAFVYSAFFATGVLIQPIGGAVADSFGERPTIVGVTVLAAVGLVLLVMASGFWPIIAITVLLSAQLGFWPVAQAAVIDAIPTEMQGTGFGFLRTMYLILAAPASTVVGILGNQGMLNEAFLLLAGCALGSTVLGVFLLRD